VALISPVADSVMYKRARVFHLEVLAEQPEESAGGVIA